MLVRCVHIRFFIFFFFKQKTAYEMRISDWSSDVCSSDLAVRAETERQAAESGIAEAGRAYCAVLGADAGEAAAAAIARHDWPVLKIGRASCRERVCPDV